MSASGNKQPILQVEDLAVAYATLKRSRASACP
jgi:hypothetical protein